jgi:hypothetical protein
MLLSESLSSSSTTSVFDGGLAVLLPKLPLLNLTAFVLSALPAAPPANVPPENAAKSDGPAGKMPEGKASSKVSGCDRSVASSR